MEPRRTVHCEDALAFLARHPRFDGASVVTSLPDVSETPLSFEVWREWFSQTAAELMQRCPDEGVAIFYQTDLKRPDGWVDKAYLVQRGAERAGVRLLWHKVACRKPAGTVTFGRPGFAHLLCFARRLTLDLGQSTPDVLPSIGEMTWSRAAGVEACRVACQFIRDQTVTRTVVDPFCGHGTILAVANAFGLDAVGVDHSRRRCAKARALQLTLP